MHGLPTQQQHHEIPRRGGSSGGGVSRPVQIAAVFSLLGAGLVWTLLRYSNDPAAVLLLKGRWDTRYRVFGPSTGENLIVTEPGLKHVSFQVFTRDDQRDFLLQYGRYCQKGFTKSTDNLILDRFEELPEPYSTELWKYCVLYTGVANVYWQADNAVPLVLWEDLLKEEHAGINFAVEIEGPALPDNSLTEKKAPPVRLHHSFLRIAKPHSKVCLGLMRFLTESKGPLHAAELAETLGLYVTHDKGKKARDKKKNDHHHHKWKFFTARCLDLANEVEQSKHLDSLLVQPSSRRSLHETAKLADQCPISNGGHCCQVWRSFSTGEDEHFPAMVIRHPMVTSTKRVDTPLPFSFIDRPESEMTKENLGMRVEDVPYVATIREYPTGAEPATQMETPNFFDILLSNNCLPQDKDCFKCLKTGYEGEAGGDCQLCQAQCPCYCSALCQIRPPPKRLVGEWEVTRPRERRDPTRLIPRIIHQTWFEPVTKEKYPNMSRLIESFRQSGWQYEFYDDDRAGQFISAHFPPQVREAYDAIIPGAFKADLFRYCVLLIMGGVYADMDILLESNLDEVFHPTVGFMTPQDSPGMTIGHRHCLWNGLMGSAPGHPFLAKTVENVVNNVRNRFTSVDYDDMLCPNPVLAVSHTVDTLFTAGPCILGASINDVLKLHRQTSFDYGDIDLFQSEHNEGKVTIDPEGDPRFLIPGRSIILKQNKEDMGAHRFTWDEKNIVVSATDMPDYDDRPPSLEHYSKTHEKFGVYGLHKLYTDSKRANEEFTITVLP